MEPVPRIAEEQFTISKDTPNSISGHLSLALVEGAGQIGHLFDVSGLVRGNRPLRVSIQVTRGDSRFFQLLRYRCDGLPEDGSISRRDDVDLLLQVPILIHQVTVALIYGVAESGIRRIDFLEVGGLDVEGREDGIGLVAFLCDRDPIIAGLL